MIPLADGRGLLEDAVRYVLSVAPQVTPGDLFSPTPCAGWNLRTLLDHLSDSVSMLAAGLATGSLGPEPAYVAVPRAGLGDLSTDPVAALELHCAELLTVCATAPPDQMIALGPHDLTASLICCAGAIEIAVHGWDIVAACAGPQSVPSVLADRLLPLAALLVTDATRASQFGEPVPGRACAPAGDRLVAFLGRSPAWPAAAKLASGPGREG